MMKIFLACGFSLLGTNTSANAQAPIYLTQSQCAAIFQAAGDSYAGMWLAEDGQFVLGLTSEVYLDDAILKKLRIERVKYSEVELERFHNEVVKRKFSSHPDISSTHIDRKVNRVVVTAPKNRLQDVINFFKASSVDLAMLDFRVQTTTVTFMAILDDGSCKT
ncbi:hypothetical protein [Comamonas sp. JUb58]|uniref:hypothetical protein n=1 Tax=Comamonas sp. JUb58 TaxID=2485114 RepID=UPI00105E6B4E|nr:hypothetical protein [Comamonas sp. JUb58]TDS73157.1 hypothetical protein EDF71_12218 [Comamonas sp. JUb58]